MTTTAVESAINALEAHGLDRCPDHGIDGFKRYIALAVFTRGRPKTHAALVMIGIVTLILLTAKFAVFSWVA